MAGTREPRPVAEPPREELSAERLAELERMAAAIHLEVIGGCQPEVMRHHRIYGRTATNKEGDFVSGALLSTEWECHERLGRFRATKSVPRFAGPGAAPSRASDAEAEQAYGWQEYTWKDDAMDLPPETPWKPPAPHGAAAGWPRLLGSRLSAGPIIPAASRAPPPAAAVPDGARLAATKAKGTAAELDLLGRYGMDMHWRLHEAAASGAQLGSLTPEDLALADKLAGVLSGGRAAGAAQGSRAGGAAKPAGTGRGLPSAPPGVFIREPSAASTPSVRSSSSAGSARKAAADAAEAAAVTAAAPPVVPAAARAAQTAGPELRSDALPSKGSAGHGRGACKPCAFIYKGGCESGASCTFCHLCEPGEKKRRKKERQQNAKLRMRAAAHK